ncbi:DUF413 domain-containing protein [Neiella sp. HB171785]|uniref:Macrodomain Ori protein n=1 Tax=Neiella litorisoli TaxID=2771431 RepID=A0A8J6QNJ2_9GAMM|nr:DUF413 domain-containing protein [Neiella litorisoli]MBD1391331.1 DUF413 domain-containing protein [Neiella litorisoli]
MSIRHGHKAYYDFVKFPRGFNKTGDFTLKEADLLTHFGHTLVALEQRQLQPLNSEELHFVDVVSGLTEPQTLLEKAWLKYIKLSRCHRAFHGLCGSKRSLSEPVVESDSDNDDYFGD